MRAYLVDLALRLAEGVEHLAADVINRHADFVLGLQRDDGGFAGREGESDAYYTSFALRTLAITGRLEEEVADRAAAFVDQQLDRVDGSVDFISTIFSASQIEAATGTSLLSTRNRQWKDRVVRAWQELRRDDGGFAKTIQGGSGSTYHTFLIVIASQLLELPVMDASCIIDFVRSRQREDGGFVEIAAMRRSGTNPTAAATALLTILSELDDPTRALTLEFLSNMQSDEGGLTANTRIPVADLLSTFTGLLTFANLADDAKTQVTVDLPAMSRYVMALEQSGGGFVGGVWDNEADVEYTFYGLGSLALLASANA